jgi:hypothetical protein
VDTAPAWAPEVGEGRGHLLDSMNLTTALVSGNARSPQPPPPGSAAGYAPRAPE